MRNDLPDEKMRSLIAANAKASRNVSYTNRAVKLSVRWCTECGKQIKAPHRFIKEDGMYRHRNCVIPTAKA